MDNDDDILKQFGGSIANDLNNALKIDGDKEDSERIQELSAEQMSPSKDEHNGRATHRNELFH